MKGDGRAGETGRIWEYIAGILRGPEVDAQGAGGFYVGAGWTRSEGRRIFARRLPPVPGKSCLHSL